MMLVGIDYKPPRNKTSRERLQLRINNRARIWV